ncbi:MAG: hypothetical protein JXQ99_03545 [Hyphomicrobiaceae bacterium]
MVRTAHHSNDPHLIRIEPDDRLVALARIMDVRDPEADTALVDNAKNGARFGETCIGQALYRHRSVFQSASDALVWSHVELSYFRNFVSADALRELEGDPQRAGLRLLRAELLLTTPASFVMPIDWQGSSARPELQASLEFIQVEPKYLKKYRGVMRDYCGPAAQKLVRSNKFGTFRAMETAAVLYQAPGLNIEWNQLHVCELEADGFVGFGKAFGDVLREDLPDGAELSDAFADLGQIRTVPRWTFNETVVEADTALAHLGTSEA